VLKRLKDLFSKELSGDAGEQRPEMDLPEYQLKLATAVLLVQVMRVDWEEAPVEREVIMDALADNFELELDVTRQLVEIAEKEAHDAISLHPFTRLLNEELTAAQKKHIVKLLWLVVYADGFKDMQEEQLVRRIANLLHVSHEDFVETRNEIRRQTTGSSEAGQ
jgi:uncharacterized tellurite resistance protein B-like protein